MVLPEQSDARQLLLKEEDAHHQKELSYIKELEKLNDLQIPADKLALSLKNISFNYPNGNFSIQDINFNLEDGLFLALLGPSGSGKSTILRLIAGFERVSHGTITIDGRVVNSERDYIPPEGRKVGFVFQDYALFPHLSVEKNIGFGIKSENKQKRVAEMLDLTKLGNIGNKYPYELSGGQQQRVALARSLAPNPTLLLLDEPFSNLDEILKVRIRNEVKEILLKAATTTILVSHDLHDVIHIADRVIRIENGQRLF